VPTVVESDANDLSWRWNANTGDGILYWPAMSGSALKELQRLITPTDQCIHRSRDSVGFDGHQTVPVVDCESEAIHGLYVSDTHSGTPLPRLVDGEDTQLDGDLTR
jgi:hypothetical protein